METPPRFRFDSMQASTDDAISWICSLTQLELNQILCHFHINMRGKLNELRWRLLRYYQRRRGINVTWVITEDEKWPRDPETISLQSSELHDPNAPRIALPITKNPFSDTRPHPLPITPPGQTTNPSLASPHESLTSQHLQTSSITPDRKHLDQLNIFRIWDLKFPGHRQISPEEFLIRASEFRLASGFTEEDLLRSLPILLDGSALIWYRLNRSTWKNWEEFADALQMRFSGPDFYIKLYNDCQRRTQGPDEPLADYLDCLRTMMNILWPPIAYAAQLDLAYKNLHPTYRSMIMSNSFSTFEELLRAGNDAESAQLMGRRLYTPPLTENISTPPHINDSKRKRV